MIILGSFLTSLLISFLTIPSIIKLAEVKHLFDEPDERKSHNFRVPTLGGIAIFAAFALSLSLWGDFSKVLEIQYVLCATLLMFFMGLKDDIFPIVAWKKLLTQIIAASILILLGDIRLSSLYRLLGIQEISYFWSYIVSLLAIVGITNSFNLIDGVNTLAAGLGIFITSIYGGWFYYYGYTEYALMAFCLSGALTGFLYYNKTPAKIFMGDTGSLLIGVVCSVLAIKFIEINRAKSIVTSAPAVALGIMIVPIFDTLRVFVIRIINKKSPLRPDKNHLHHLLLRRGLNHLQTSGLLIGLNAAFTLLVFSINIKKGEILLGVILILATLFSSWINPKNESDNTW